MKGSISRRLVLRGAGALGLAAASELVIRESASAAPNTPTAPQMTVTLNTPGVAPGHIYFTYGNGAEIADAAGTPLWTTSSSDGYTNFQRQIYRGNDVLTWWQGSGGPAAGGTGSGTDVLTTAGHQAVATIGPSGVYYPDSHEFRITPQNTALITSYVTVPYDLTAVGGPANGQVSNSYCEEVDIASGTVLHRWSALDHVPLADSYQPVPTTATQPYDYFHINSISLTPDNQLLISSRHTCALYKVNRTTGDMIWSLGGKSSSFSLTPDAVFGYQHHAIFENPRTIRLFDNGSNGLSALHPTRVAWIRIDPGAMTASLANSMSIPANAQTFAMGSAQRLPNGNVFVCWGANPRLSEFSPHGDLLFDATLTTASYRAFKIQS